MKEIKVPLWFLLLMITNCVALVIDNIYILIHTL